MKYRNFVVLLQIFSVKNGQMHWFAEKTVELVKNEEWINPHSYAIRPKRITCKLSINETHSSSKQRPAHSPSKRWGLSTGAMCQPWDSLTCQKELKEKTKLFAHSPWTISKNVLKPVSIEVNLLSLRWSVDISNNVLSFIFTHCISLFFKLCCAHNIYKNKDESEKKTVSCVSQRR